MPYALGVVDLVFGSGTSTVGAAALAAGHGFAHIDLARGGDVDEGIALALPVVDRFALWPPHPGRSTGAPPEGDGMWERAVRAFRRAPGSRIEPWPGSILNSVAAVRAFLAEVPDVTLCLDTGHIACWGEDPCDLIPYATHVQLRQARRGHAQTMEGDIDFALFFDKLRRQRYAGAVSVEYFDLPEWGWPLTDPLSHALALAAHVRPYL